MKHTKDLKAITADTIGDKIRPIGHYPLSRVLDATIAA